MASKQMVALLGLGVILSAGGALFAPPESKDLYAGRLPGYFDGHTSATAQPWAERRHWVTGCKPTFSRVGGGVMANLNSVPSERSHDIWQAWARQLDDAQRRGLDDPDRALLFDSLLTDDDRKFLWAMWIDFRHSSTEVA